MDQNKVLEHYLIHLDKVDANHKGFTPPTTKENAVLIKEFIRNKQALPKPPSILRLKLLAIRLKVISNLVNHKRLDELTEEDIKDLNPKLRVKCPKSSSDYRKVLKQFWKLKNKKQFLDLIDSEYMKTPPENRDFVDAERFWTQKQTEDYIEESKRHSPRQLCWAAIISSCGLRPGEQFMLRKNSVEYEEPYLTIRVPGGKTGKRDVILQGAEAKAIWNYLVPYLDTLQDSDLLFPICYRMQKTVHDKICKIIKLPKDKDKKFYVFRKMNVTRFYSELGLVKGAAQSGHVPGSKVMSRYVALTSNQRKGEKFVTIQKKICPNPLCLQENEAHATQCSKCQAPLDVKKYGDLVRKEKDDFAQQMKEMVDLRFEVLFAKLDAKMKEAGIN